MKNKPTDPVAVQEWMESLGFKQRPANHPIFWYHPSGTNIRLEYAEFFYNVAQQQMVAAQAKELKRAKMQGYIPADLVHKVDRRISVLEVKLLQQTKLAEK